MARRILRCHGKTSNEAVIGELGWWRLKTRREYIKLKYWIHILLLDDTRLVKKVYNLSKQQYVAQNTDNWCKHIHKLAFKYNIGNFWSDETLIKQHIPTVEGDPSPMQLKRYWIKRLYDNVHREEEIAWQAAVAAKPKLRTYKTFKTKLELEKYLLSEHNKPARYLLTRIRSGTNQLRIETGRWKRPMEKEAERICNFCADDAIENEQHFILSCPAYGDLRKALFATIVDANPKITLDTFENQWKILMSNHSVPKVADSLKEYIGKANRRRKLMSGELQNA